MQTSKKVFDTSQLLGIARNCKRWSGIQSLPRAIRNRLKDVEILTQHLQPANATATGNPEFVESIKRSCVSLKSEFSRAQIAFDCPGCPLSSQD